VILAATRPSRAGSTPDGPNRRQQHPRSLRPRRSEYRHTPSPTIAHRRVVAQTGGLSEGFMNRGSAARHPRRKGRTRPQPSRIAQTLDLMVLLTVTCPQCGAAVPDVTAPVHKYCPQSPRLLAALWADRGRRVPPVRMPARASHRRRRIPREGQTGAIASQCSSTTPDSMPWRSRPVQRSGSSSLLPMRPSSTSRVGVPRLHRRGHQPLCIVERLPPAPAGHSAASTLGQPDQAARAPSSSRRSYITTKVATCVRSGSVS
jgi:hypothetical protein